MKSLLIFLIIVLSSVSSYSQKIQYNVIQKNVNFYEFNSSRDKIYIYSYYNGLSVYDIKNESTTIIDTGMLAETNHLKYPLFLSETGLIYFVSEEEIYIIKEETIIKKIPIVYDEYRYGAINSETRARDEKRMNKLNLLIEEYDNSDIQEIFGKIIILSQKNKKSIAFYNRRVRNSSMASENKIKINNYQKIIKYVNDTSFTLKKTKNGVDNYFENNKLTINEKVFSCRKPSFMSLISNCKYKINIKVNKKIISLKDTHRDTRISYYNSSRISAELIDYIPNSRYITDKFGNIYINFTIKKQRKLIKISADNFN